MLAPPPQSTTSSRHTNFVSRRSESPLSSFVPSDIKTHLLASSSNTFLTVTPSATVDAIRLFNASKPTVPHICSFSPLPFTPSYASFCYLTQVGPGTFICSSSPGANPKRDVRVSDLMLYDSSGWRTDFRFAFRKRLATGRRNPLIRSVCWVPGIGSGSVGALSLGEVEDGPMGFLCVAIPGPQAHHSKESYLTLFDASGMRSLGEISEEEQQDVGPRHIPRIDRSLVFGREYEIPFGVRCLCPSRGFVGGVFVGGGPMEALGPVGSQNSTPGLMFLDLESGKRVWEVSEGRVRALAAFRNQNLLCSSTDIAGSKEDAESMVILRESATGKCCGVLRSSLAPVSDDSDPRVFRTINIFGQPTQFTRGIGPRPVVLPPGSRRRFAKKICVHEEKSMVFALLGHRIAAWDIRKASSSSSPTDPLFMVGKGVSDFDLLDCGTRIAACGGRGLAIFRCVDGKLLLTNSCSRNRSTSASLVANHTAKHFVSSDFVEWGDEHGRICLIFQLLLGSFVTFQIGEVRSQGIQLPRSYLVKPF